jgi:hypothetical protein
MQTLIDSTVVVVLSGLVLLAGTMAYRLWHAGVRDERGLLMHRMFEHEGVRLNASTDEAAAMQTAAAARRCLLCRDKETCIGWLEGESTERLEHFCQNADVIAGLKGRLRA